MRPISLEGRVALVTGGTRGIGLAIARALHGAGARVALTGRDAGRAAEVAATLGDGVLRVARGVADAAQVAAAVTGQDAPMADAQQAGKNMGFDTHTYPGDKTMAAWKAAPGAPYRWVGYYLPAPCHRDRSWTGKRQKLVEMGWGLAVVYVGQQTWGRTPRPLSPSDSRLARTTIDRSGGTSPFAPV